MDSIETLVSILRDLIHEGHNEFKSDVCDALNTIVEALSELEHQVRMLKIAIDNQESRLRDLE